MKSYKINRRDLIEYALKGSISLPFAMNPMFKQAFGQAIPSGQPMRLINLVLPYTPLPLRMNNSDPAYFGLLSQDHFARAMWDQSSSTVRPYLRFLTDFSYNTRHVNWHGLAGYSFLFTSTPIVEARSSHTDVQVRNSFDYLVAQHLGSLGYSPYALASQGPLNLMAVTGYPAHLMTNESLGFLPPNVVEGNYSPFLTYKGDGTVENSLLPSSAETMAHIFGFGNSNSSTPVNTDPSAIERTLAMISGNGIDRYITQKSINDTQDSYNKLLNLRNRINRHISRMESERLGSNSGGSNSCNSQPSPFPGAAAGLDARMDYCFEAIYHTIRCDMHRVINFAISTSEGEGSDIARFEINGANVADVHNSCHLDDEGDTFNFREFDTALPKRAAIKPMYDYYFNKINSFLEQLANMEDPTLPSGSGSVLDNSIIYISSSNGCGIGGVHSGNNMALMIAGGGRRIDSNNHLLPNLGAQSLGDHIFDGRNRYDSSISEDQNDLVANLQLRILNMFGLNMTSFGSGRCASRNNGAHQTILTNPQAYLASK